jgi:hypothetical protein
VGNFVVNQETIILPWTLLCEVSCTTAVAIHSNIHSLVCSFIHLFIHFVKAFCQNTDKGHTNELIDMKPLEKSILDNIFVSKQNISQEFFK